MGYLSRDPAGAVTALIALVRSIKGTGYYTQLTCVVEALIVPEDSDAPMLPYAAVVPDDAPATVVLGESTVELLSRLTVYFFVPENSSSEGAPSSVIAAYQALGDWAKAFLLDAQDGDPLSGLVDEVVLGPPEFDAGVVIGKYGEVRFPVLLRQVTGPDGLGPS